MKRLRRPPDSKEEIIGTNAATSMNEASVSQPPTNAKKNLRFLIREMFCGFLGEKFSSKCKHALKCIKMRVVPIRNKRQAVVRLLKKDVADLIARGEEVNAFGRIDALLVEINHVSCYDFIEKSSQRVMAQLSILQKQKECPEEVMEEISTLIYAAARFPDLPELGVLRHMFVEKYDSFMESSVCHEFAENLENKTFSKEKKLKLMESIAQEYGISWDAKEYGNASTSDSDQWEEVDKEMEVNEISVISATQSGHGSPRGVVKHDLPSQSRVENELNSTVEDKGVVSLKPLNPKPVDVTPPYTKSDATGYHAEETRAEEHEEGLDSIELRKQPARPLTDLLPPYRRPGFKDQNTVTEETCHQGNGERKQFQKPMAAEADGTVVDDERTPRSRIPGGRDDLEKAAGGDSSEHEIDGNGIHYEGDSSEDEIDGNGIHYEGDSSEDEIDDDGIHHEELSPQTSDGNKRNGGRQYEGEEKVVDSLLKHYGWKETPAKESSKERPENEVPVQARTTLVPTHTNGARAPPRLPPDFDQLVANLAALK